jgi:fluoride exporter
MDIVVRGIFNQYKMLHTIILVAIGGAVGSVARFAVGEWLVTNSTYLATLTVNIIGGLAIGCFWALIEKSKLQAAFSALLITGFCGGFTTFSAFSREVLMMLQSQKIGLAIVYTLVSVFFSIFAVAAGYWLFKK